tara:strand:- start:156 stop:821 length:666 start_codon:yes stop_codon:yes gene_type:complete
MKNIKLSLKHVIEFERKRFNETHLLNQENELFGRDKNDPENEEDQNVVTLEFNKQKVFRLEQQLNVLHNKLDKAFKSKTKSKFVHEMGLQEQVRQAMEQLLLLGVGMSGTKTYCENANEEQIDPMSLQYNNVEDSQTHLDQTYHMKIKAEPRFEYSNIESCLQEISSTSKFKILKEKYLPKIQNELEASKIILKNRQIQIDSLRAKVSLIVDFIKTKVGRP